VEIEVAVEKQCPHKALYMKPRIMVVQMVVEGT